MKRIIKPDVSCRFFLKHQLRFYALNKIVTQNITDDQGISLLPTPFISNLAKRKWEGRLAPTLRSVLSRLRMLTISASICSHYPYYHFSNPPTLPDQSLTLPSPTSPHNLPHYFHQSFRNCLNISFLSGLPNK